MKIIYSPFYSGNYYLNMQDNQVALDVQVLETQGLLTQLAMHAGIHQQIPSYPERLASYHKALLDYDKDHADSTFHKSIDIDSMSVAKTLLQWRDYLTLCGWNSDTDLSKCARLNTLAEIDKGYEDKGLAKLLSKLQEQLNLMVSGEATVPSIYKELTIEIPCALELLPDYIQPILNSLRSLGVTIEVNEEDTNAMPETINEIHFTQQWKAEAWLSQQDPNAYDLWINTDNKRLDNWLHMSGQPVCGSEMENANPQITQLFLLAVQLFQRPLNVNTLLQYLYLPECPLDGELSHRMAKQIVREGGFSNDKVLDCINAFVDNEFKEPNDNTQRRMTREQREGNYLTYLPFDLRKEKDSLPLSEESDIVDFKLFKRFMQTIYSHATTKATSLLNVSPNDARIAQLQTVSELIKSLLELIGQPKDNKLRYTTLAQWSQSLYEPDDYLLYQAQTGSRCIINNPSNMIGTANRTIWCDFYGDIQTARSTDFLSNNEQEQLRLAGVKIWDKDHEADLQHIMLTKPIHKTSLKLILITCDMQGATKLPQHPLLLQLPQRQEPENGDNLYNQIATREVIHVDNRLEEDKHKILFDAEKHPVRWREKESFSALEKLLQDPLDYVMKYTLEFSDLSDTEIKMTLTNGNVAHETIEDLFTSERNGVTLENFVVTNFEKAFHRALVRKGALLLLPEHHLNLEILRHQLLRCVKKLAVIINENGLTVEKCEQKGELAFTKNVKLAGYLDMRLHDTSGKDVVFDLKWTSSKDKHEKLIKSNRAMQLAIYEAMLTNPSNQEETIRKGFFAMPAGILYSSDEFMGDNCKLVTPDAQVKMMEQIKNGYTERVNEINDGWIEIGDLDPIVKLRYNNAVNVFPLDQVGKQIIGEDGKQKKIKVKTENKYSDYKCFTK